MKEKEFQQRIKPINYPNRLLELGGLIELFDFEESESQESTEEHDILSMTSQLFQKDNVNRSRNSCRPRSAPFIGRQNGHKNQVPKSFAMRRTNVQ